MQIRREGEEQRRCADKQEEDRRECTFFSVEFFEDESVASFRARSCTTISLIPNILKAVTAMTPHEAKRNTYLNIED